MSRLADIDSKFTLHKRQAAKTTDTHLRTSTDQRHGRRSPPVRLAGAEEAATLAEFRPRMNESPPQKWYVFVRWECCMGQLLRDC